MVNFAGMDIGTVSRYTEGNTSEQFSKEQVERRFLDALEECDYIFWTQYTPGFNDGDACLFSASEPVFLKTDKRMDEIISSVRDDPYGDDEELDGIVSFREPDVSYYQRMVDSKKLTLSDFRRTRSLPVNEWRYRGMSAESAESMMEGSVLEYQTLLEKTKVKLATFAQPHDSLLELRKSWSNLENVLHGAFGDPTLVVIGKDRIFHEDYDCGY
jgi:hypothetical protein